MRKFDKGWRSQATSAEDAIEHIKSGMKVFVHGAAATPTPLLNALCRRPDLENVNLYHRHLAGCIPFADLEKSEWRIFHFPVYRACNAQTDTGRAR